MFAKNSTTVSVSESIVYGARVFHQGKRSLLGACELPASFVAMHRDRLLIVGDPAKDVIQCALSEAGFNRLAVERAGPGAGMQSLKGLLIDMHV